MPKPARSVSYEIEYQRYIGTDRGEKYYTTCVDEGYNSYGDARKHVVWLKTMQKHLVVKDIKVYKVIVQREEVTADVRD